MKILVISDIHANLPALNAVLEKESDADRIICAGDLVNYGYHPHEVIEIFRRTEIGTVCGNHDLEIIRNATLKRGERAVGFTKFTVEQMTGEDIEYLASLPRSLNFEADGVNYCVRHAYNTIERKNQFLLSLIGKDSLRAFDTRWKKYSNAPNAEKKCFILGHSHNACIFSLSDDRSVYNPGTLYYLKGRDERAYRAASYMVINDGIPEIRHCDYDNSENARLDRETNRFGASYYLNHLHGKQDDK